jgi:hypothetical protein
LYVYLRDIPEIDLTLDDWKILRVVSETADSLRAVGIMYVLPSSEVPIEVELFKHPGSIAYVVRVGITDQRWSSLSDSKRWKAVYLYATGEQEEGWNWSEPLSGSSSCP